MAKTRPVVIHGGTLIDAASDRDGEFDLLIEEGKVKAIEKPGVLKEHADAERIDANTVRTRAMGTNGVRGRDRDVAVGTGHEAVAGGYAVAVRAARDDRAGVADRRRTGGSVDSEDALGIVAVGRDRAFYRDRDIACTREPTPEVVGLDAARVVTLCGGVALGDHPDD